jgi:uncharacterized protein YdeI (YjbR/CyaY-like superfamily)
MGIRDSRIDAYIAKQKDFAKPILTHIRAVVHEGCPDCEETLKWNMPAFMYHGILCGMAAFKEYAVFMFWKGTLIVGNGGKSLEAMGSLGRITRIEDLPPKSELIDYVRKAMELNEKGVKAPPKRSAPKKRIAMPGDLKSALSKNKKAKATYDAFSASHRREYLEWITEAKGADTRKRRVDQAVMWMSEGKARNWKYM